MRKHNRQVGNGLRKRCRAGVLMCRVEIGEEEADGDCLGASALQGDRGVANLVERQRIDFASVRADPPVDFMDRGAVHQKMRRGGTCDRVIKVDPVLARQCQRVGKAACRQQPNRRDVTRQHKVQGARRADPDLIKRRQRHRPMFTCKADGLEDRRAGLGAFVRQFQRPHRSAGAQCEVDG